MTPIWLPRSSSTGRWFFDDRVALVTCWTSRTYDQLDGGPGGPLDEVRELCPTGDGHAVELDDLVTGQQAGLRGGGLWICRQAIGLLSGAGRCGRDHTLTDGRDGGTRCRYTDTDHQNPEDPDRQDEVHHRSGDHHDDPLTRVQLVELPAVIGRSDLRAVTGAGFLHDVADHAGRPHGGGADLLPTVGARRHHADHPDIAAQRDRLEAVFRLPDLLGEHGLAEADHVLGGPDIE